MGNDFVSQVHLCSFSDQQDYKIRADGKEYIFDFSERFGPSVQRRDGRGEIKNQPGPGAEFWLAVTLWRRQGKRIGDDGFCVWDELPKEIAYQIGPRTLVSKSLYDKLRSEGRVPELEPLVLDTRRRRGEPIERK